MQRFLFATLLMLIGTAYLSAVEPVTKAADGTPIPHPTSKTTRPVKDGDRTIEVPEGMVYIPAGEFTAGTGSSARKVKLEGYCIGIYHVTNAEYKAFLDATNSRSAPRYWTGGTYPRDRANHPVAFVSLDQARAYARWVSKETGWDVAIPTADQWEKAARGPKNTLYPWGDSMGVTYKDGVLTTRFNYNAVTAVHYLTKEPKREVTYNNSRSKFYGTKTTVDQIAGLDENGRGTPLSVSPTGSVRGWVSHTTNTGFIYTDLFTELNAKGGNTSTVGSYPEGKSGYGCHDMAGNLWAWTETIIVATNGAEKGKSVNEIRGGSWYANGTSAKSVSIGEGRAASGGYNTVGFRIVMNLKK